MQVFCNLYQCSYFQNLNCILIINVFNRAYPRLFFSPVIQSQIQLTCLYIIKLFLLLFCCRYCMSDEVILIFNVDFNHSFIHASSAWLAVGRFSCIVQLLCFIYLFITTLFSVQGYFSFDIFIEYIECLPTLIFKISPL